MASASLYTPTLTPSRDSSRAQLKPASGLSFPFFNFRPRTGTDLRVNNTPLPLRILCMRRSKGAREEKKVKSDPVYHNRLVNMMVNRVLRNGKKSLAFLIIYKALKRIQQTTGKNPLVVLRNAVEEATPEVIVKPRRVGGSTQRVPVELGSTQAKALAIRWLLAASRKRQGRSMVFKLSSELIDAENKTGGAVKKKEETHKVAEDNKAFAHLR